MFNEVQAVRGFEDIALQIQEAVANGRLKVGDRLPSERELGGLFGVSRPTLREAIRSLETLGVVEVRRGTSGGTFICEPKADRVGQALSALIRFRGATAIELAEFRTNFEAENAFWAARRATDVDIAKMRRITDWFQETANNPTAPWSDIVDLDLAFHEAVTRASGNQIRVAIILAIHDVLRKSALLIGNSEGAAWRSQQVTDLKRIVAAISQHNEEAAKQFMEQHVSRNLQAIVREEGLQSADSHRSK